VLGDRKEGQQTVTNAGGNLLGLTLVAINPENIESGLDQALGGLPVEAYFRAAAARSELETVVCTSFVQALRNDFRIGFED
jgi:hypothetical protein